MTGLQRGKVEMFFSSQNYVSGDVNSYYAGQAAFKGFYDFCISHPNMTLIARHGGLSSTSANTGYYDEASPFLNNAWFVVRMEPTASRTWPWYMYVQWMRYDGGNNFNAAPAAPSLIEASTAAPGNFSGTIGVQFAIGIGGTENPWNGAGTMGQNTKGTPVWTTPVGGTGVLVFPRSNNVGGSHSSSRQNCTRLMCKANTTSPMRMHIVADDDNIVVAVDHADSASYDITYFGTYSLRSSLQSSITHNAVHFSTNGWTLPFVPGTTYGSSTGVNGSSLTDNKCGGGMALYPISSGVASVTTDRYAFATGHTSSAAYTLAGSVQPNKLFPITPQATWDEYPLMFVAQDSTIADGMGYGYGGQIDFIREVSNLYCYDLIADGDRIVLGGINDPRAAKITIPWDSSIRPRSGSTREGITFVK